MGIFVKLVLKESEVIKFMPGRIHRTCKIRNAPEILPSDGGGSTFEFPKRLVHPQVESSESRSENADRGRLAGYNERRYARRLWSDQMGFWELGEGVD